MRGWTKSFGADSFVRHVRQRGLAEVVRNPSIHRNIELQKDIATYLFIWIMYKFNRTSAKTSE